ncbi:hypothetical protein ACFLHV_005109, partial [Escherichia coli]
VHARGRQPQAPAAILLNSRYLANMKSIRKVIHKSNSKTIDCHYSRYSFSDLFCGNGTQHPVTTTTSLNALSQSQANTLVRFERKADRSLNNQLRHYKKHVLIEITRVNI